MTAHARWVRRFTLYVAASFLLSCSGAQKILGDFIECTKGNGGSLVKEAGDAMDQLLVRATGGDGHVDKAAIKAAAKSFATDTMMCVLADSIKRAVAPAPADPKAPRSSPVVANEAELRALFDELRNEKAPGKTYRTQAGDL